MVQKMKVDELKMFLRLRDLKVSGKKAELVARVFAASENNVPLKKTAAEVESDLRDEYQAKLLINSDLLPDPNHLTSGWLNEEDGGIYSIGHVFCMPMLNFLSFHPGELGSSDLSDYKTSKAYSYCLYCFLKANCRPSERLNDPPHKLWICVSKKDAVIKVL